MVLTENQRMIRQKFMPIAVLEHHQMIDPAVDAYDICERLGPVWLEIQREAQACTFTLDADCIQSISARVARSLGMDTGIFRNKEGWAGFLDGGGNTEDGPVYNSMFSTSTGTTLPSLGFPPRGFSRTLSGYNINSRNTA